MAHDLIGQLVALVLVKEFLVPAVVVVKSTFEEPKSITLAAIESAERVLQF